MVILVWILLGSITGFLASKLFHRTAFALDVTLGVVGAVAGGLAFNLLGFPQIAAIIVAGSFGAVGGAIAVLAGYRAIFRRA